MNTLAWDKQSKNVGVTSTLHLEKYSGRSVQVFFLPVANKSGAVYWLDWLSRGARTSIDVAATLICGGCPLPQGDTHHSATRKKSN